MWHCGSDSVTWLLFQWRLPLMVETNTSVIIPLDLSLKYTMSKRWKPFHQSVNS